MKLIRMIEGRLVGTRFREKGDSLEVDDITASRLITSGVAVLDTGEIEVAALRPASREVARIKRTKV